MSKTISPAESDPDPAPADIIDVPAGTSPEKTPPEQKIPDPTRYGDWEKNGRCIDF